MLHSLSEERDPMRLAAEHALIHSNEGLVVVKNLSGIGRFMSDSELMWRFRAAASVAIDDDRTIGDFNLIAIRTCWLHSDAPISRMSLRSAMDTLVGLEWALCSDVFTWDQRTAVWFNQFSRAFTLTLNRLFYLYEHECDPDILNVVEYVDRTYDERLEKDEIDYDSDEERGCAPPPKRIKVDERIKALVRHPVRMNDMCVLTANTASRAIEDALFTRSILQCTQIPKLDLNSLRRLVFSEATEVRGDGLLSYCQSWYHDLVCTASYVRVYHQRTPHDSRPMSRNVLVDKNVELGTTDYAPESVEDMTMRRVVGSKALVLARLHADACFFYSSMSVPTRDEIKALWVGVLDWRSLPDGKEAQIGRLPAEERYVLFVGNDKFSATSFMAAFVFWRCTFGDGKSSRYDSSAKG